MGYPRKYVGHYHLLAEWLKNNSHAVYPMEMFCEPVRVGDLDTPNGYLRARHLYGYVDVVSYFSGKLYAWEYKSRHDNIKRALSQLENYSRSFDFVSLVAQDLKKLTNIRDKLRAIGAGSYYLQGGTYCLLDSPRQQTPIPSLHANLVSRFQRNVFPNEHARIQRGLQKLEEKEKFQKQHRLLTEFT